MSRQINFYMDKTTEFQFIQFIKNSGFIFVRRSDGITVDPCDDKDLFLFIIREKYLQFLKFRNNSVDVLNSLGIEYRRNNIIEDKKIVTGGRIYICDAYKDEKYSIYMEDFVKDYNKLKGWIIKRVPYQNYYNMGKIKNKVYICDSMLMYSENNYRFQA